MKKNGSLIWVSITLFNFLLLVLIKKIRTFYFRNAGLFYRRSLSRLWRMLVFAILNGLWDFMVYILSLINEFYEEIWFIPNNKIDMGPFVEKLLPLKNDEIDSKIKMPKNVLQDRDSVPFNVTLFGNELKSEFEISITNYYWSDPLYLYDLKIFRSNVKSAAN